MIFLPVSWTISRINPLPIVYITGKCNFLEAKKVMISEAVRMIEDADKFKGKPLQMATQTMPNKPSKIVIEFALIFPTRDELESFLSSTLPKA